MMNDIIEHVDKKMALSEDAIKKCETKLYLARGCAADLRHNGFDGELVGELIKHCENALKFAHSYQAYMNVIDD